MSEEIEEHYYADDTDGPEPEPEEPEPEPEEPGEPEPEEEAEVAGPKAPVIKSNEKVYVCGMNLSGKTVMAKSIIRAMRSQGVPVIVYDPIMEYGDVADNDDEIVSDIDTIANLGPLPAGAIVVYSPLNDTPELWDRFCRIIWQTQRNLWIVIDEAHDVCPSGPTISQYHSFLVRKGRHYGIGMCHVSQRPAETHKMPLAQAQHVIIYKMHLVNDIKYLEAWLQCPEIGPLMDRLEPYHYIYFDCKEGSVHVNPPIPLQ